MNTDPIACLCPSLSKTCKNQKSETFNKVRILSGSQKQTWGGNLPEQIDFFQHRISVLERRVLLLAAFCAALTIFVVVFTARDTVKAAAQPDVLTVKRLNVVDDKGTERVIIAAPVPDPMIEGKRMKRAGAASGILILDPRGKERSGYLTSDAQDHGAFLTLDSEQGQVFTAYANADSGATISLDNEKQDAIVMSTYKQPSIKIRQDKQVVFKQPLQDR